MKLLIVDDSGTMRTIQKRCLIKMGVSEDDITEAQDGVQGLEFFENNSFDVVLTDWNMPNMDGLELLKQIRERNSEIPVVMITTEAERGRVVEAVAAGISDYLVKPFSPDDLQDKLKKWIALPA